MDLEDGVYHVMSRGIDRRAIFTADKDRRHFLEVLAAARDRFRLRIYAYVLMDNHFHLIVCTPDANLSRAVQWIKVSYSMWFNSTYQRVGPLFQGRFRSELVDSSESWLVELSLYIHLNPVRVKSLGLDKHQKKAEATGWSTPSPEEAQRRLNVLRNFQWSSYPYYVGLRRTVPEWLDVSEVLDRVAVRGQQSEYLRMTELRIAHGHEEQFENQLKNRLAIGAADFLERIRGLCDPGDRDVAGRRELRDRVLWEDLISEVERLVGKSWAELQKRGEWGRYLVCWGAQKYAGVTLKEIACKCGYKDYGAVNMGLRRFIFQSKKDPVIRKAMKRLDEMFKVQT
ncbi:MAG: transposase [Pontiellaceae bacterium]|nr:transposase [Pontiellaceae bacterium]